MPRLLPLLVPLALPLLAGPGAAGPDEGAARVSIVAAEELQARLPGVTVLDAREASAFRRGHLSGAVRVDWRALTEQRAGALTLLFGDPSRWGRLAPQGEPLRSRLRALGLSRGRPVAVVGDPSGWGEEGRVAWSLLYWGAERVLLLDGGFGAWAADRARPVELGDGRGAATGDFEPRLEPGRRIEKEALRGVVASGGRPILDARDEEEFAGKKRSGQRRGGHLPGARLVPFRRLFDGSGRYVDAAGLSALVGALDGAAPPVTYCTGGVRSGLLTVLLEARLGVVAANYDGSLWEWAADASLPLALPTPGSR